MSAAPLLRDRLEAAHKLFVGVVHLGPLPGSAGEAREGHASEIGDVLAAATADARTLAEGGVDALIVENFGDAPFEPGRVAPETVAAMSRAVEAVTRAAPDVPVGVNVLRNDVRSALGLCAATAASFVRVNVHVGAMVTDQGILEGRSAETLRERARLCPRALILADVHVKHAAPLVPRAIEDVAEETLGRGGADLCIVSGTGTGVAPAAEELRRVQDACGSERLLIGSGLDATNGRALLGHARGAIVGTALKVGGAVRAPVDLERVRALRGLFASGS